MNPLQAIQILSDATEPQNAGKISRQGYVAVEQALAVLSSLVKTDEEKKEQNPEDEEL